jgi:citrate synthase
MSTAQRPERRLHSEMSYSTPDKITVRGLDLPGELIGKINFGDMAFLELMGRVPNERESTVFNAMLVTLVEHGITPSTLAARLTYLGAPEALQASVAAGLLGLGSVFVGSIEGAARLLQEALGDAPHDQDLEALAARLVQELRDRREPVPGIGHPVHKPVDPRAERLFALADEAGFAGRYVELMKLLGKEAERQSGRVLPVNATGAIAALASELQIPWKVSRGLGIMARSVGIVGHLLEETRYPMATDIWRWAEEQAQEPA